MFPGTWPRWLRKEKMKKKKKKCHVDGKKKKNASHRQFVLLTCSAVSSSFHFSSGVFLSSVSPDVAMARTDSRRDGVENGDERLRGNAAIDDDDDDDERVDAR